MLLLFLADSLGDRSSLTKKKKKNGPSHQTSPTSIEISKFVGESMYGSECAGSETNNDRNDKQTHVHIDK